MKKIAAVVLLSAVVAAPAFAADEGFYAGVTLGNGSTRGLRWVTASQAFRLPLLR